MLQRFSCISFLFKPPCSKLTIDKSGWIEVFIMERSIGALTYFITVLLLGWFHLGLFIIINNTYSDRQRCNYIDLKSLEVWNNIEKWTVQVKLK